MQLPISDQQKPLSYLAPFQKQHRFSAKNNHPTHIPHEIWQNSSLTRLSVLWLQRMKTLDQLLEV